MQSNKNTAQYFDKPTKKDLPKKLNHQELPQQVQNIQQEQTALEKSQVKLENIRQKQQQIIGQLLKSDDQFIKKQVNKMRTTLEQIFKKNTNIYEGKPYYSDGDPTMYTVDAIEKRKSIKQDEEVLKSLKKFMSIYKFDKYNEIDKEEYLRVQIEIAKILRSDLLTEERQIELVHILDNDWKHDAQGSSRLKKERLEECLFEMCDIWTPTLDREEYIEFFEMLNDKLNLKSLIKDEDKNQHDPNYNVIDNI